MLKKFISSKVSYIIVSKFTSNCNDGYLKYMIIQVHYVGKYSTYHPAYDY